MANFLKNYIPARKDVVYGRNEPRDAYLDAYVKTRGDAWDDDENGIQDDYASRKFCETKAMEATEKNKINFYNEPITALDFLVLDNPQFKFATGKDKAYIESLQKTRFQVQQVGAASLRSLSKGYAGLDQSTLDTMKPDQLRDLRGFLAIGRACKYGLDHFLGCPAHKFYDEASASEKTEAPYVHYVLDDISSDSVVSKKTVKTYIDTVGVPITTSELRYLFRNWYSFRAFLDKRLFFYVKHESTDPLWIRDPADWVPYAQHRLEKANLSGGKLAEFKSALATSGPAAALDVFFSVRMRKRILTN